MKKTVMDAEDVTRAVLIRIDEGWYDAYWYGECPTPGHVSWPEWSALAGDNYDERCASTRMSG